MNSWLCSIMSNLRVRYSLVIWGLLSALFAVISDLCKAAEDGSMVEPPGLLSSFRDPFWPPITPVKEPAYSALRDEALICLEPESHSGTHLLPYQSYLGLRFRGTIRRHDGLIALMQQPNNQLVAVALGDYLGSPRGLVVKITPWQLAIRLEHDIHSGCWQRELVYLTGEKSLKLNE